jgi:hypoxanthine phosphoribosyltransferase
VNTDRDKTIRIKDRDFRISIPSATIQDAVVRIAARMNRELDGKCPLFVAVLNGSFLFAADLMKHVTIDCEITFVKLSSYLGTSTTGTVKQLMGLNESVEGRTVVFLEDIVDTGITLESLYGQIGKLGPREVQVAALLFKPQAYTKSIKVDYVGMEVKNDFLVGYGLDYDGLGRNLRDIYAEVAGQ